MRQAIGVLFVAAALILGFGTSAQAYAEYTESDYCDASANWRIGGSANFDDTFRFPASSSRTFGGYADYVVLSSPGVLDQGDSYARVNYIDSAGVERAVNLSSWVRDTSKPGYVYRLDPNRANTWRIDLYPTTYTGVQCQVGYLQPRAA